MFSRQHRDDEIAHFVRNANERAYASNSEQEPFPLHPAGATTRPGTESHTPHYSGDVSARRLKYAHSYSGEFRTVFFV